MKCIRCECMLADDFPPLDEAGAYSQCETCFEVYMQARGWPDFPHMFKPPEGVIASPG